MTCASTTAARPSPTPGRASSRAFISHHSARGGGGGATSSIAAWATTTTCASVTCGRRRRLCRDEARRHLRRPHHCLGRRGARALCQGGRSSAWAVRRCAGLRWPGGRAERPSHRHVRRRCGGVRNRQACGDGRPSHAGRSPCSARGGRGAAGQDGQPDQRSRGLVQGLVGGDRFWRRRPGWT